MKLNIVSARTGFLWVKLGIKTFFRQPLAMASLFFMYSSAASLALLLPVVGIVLALMIEPAARLGLMVAAGEASSGRFPMPIVLISAFRAGRERLKSMVILGLLHALACVCVMALSMLFSAGTPKTDVLTPEAQLMLIAPSMLMYLPVSMLFWHAPALVHFHGISPVKSLFFSIVACLRNWKALALFGLGWAGVMLLVSLPLSMGIALAGSPQAAMPFVLPVVLGLAAMFSTSIYFTFRDSFTQELPSPVPDTPSTPV
ncbi:MAG: hypothetical protein H7332_06305 [Bdellovibrionales bacterium]|nr:hypothetical protein [Ramlibacter sp.]